jgi:hypothetical protein
MGFQNFIPVYHDNTDTNTIVSAFDPDPGAMIKV